jgi:hypothetical protein
MPIYRYRSDNYSDGNKWNAISNIYRFNAAATTKWQKIKKIYRYNASASTKWQLIFLSTDAPQPATPYSSLFVHSSTYGTVGSTTEFYSGDVVRLSRGAWTGSPTSYQMSIQTSTDAGSGYTSAATVTYNSSSSPTAANTTNSTYIPYTITSSDALYPSYYIKGRVDATNADGTTPLETPAILLRVGFGLSGFTISSITGTGATFSWNITGTPDASSYIYSQVLTIRKVSDGTVVKTVNVTPGTSTVSVYDSVNISNQTQYYAKLVVTANDSWRTSASPTTKTTDFNLFTTAGAAPVNTVSPSIIPRNNRTPPFGFAGYLPVSTSLTATQGTWNNVSGTTTYRYDWYKEDSITGALTSNLNVGSGFSYATGDVDDYVFVQVRATNTDGQFGTGTSGSYILGQRVAVGTISPTSVTQNQPATFSFAISHYPTSYTINWGDGTSNETYTVADNTSTVNASHSHTYTSSGNYTMIVTAQPGGFGNTATINVAAAAQTTGQMRRVSMPSAFTNTSQTIWVGTNGYVSVTADPTASPGTSWPSIGGVVVGPFVRDNVQTAVYTLADTNNYYVRWQGHKYGDTSQTLDYLMKFYWNSSTVDVYFITNNLDSSSGASTDAVRNANTQYSTWGSSTSITGMSVPAGMIQDFRTPVNNADDGRLDFTATKPSPPVNTVAPSVTPTSGTAGSTTYTCSTGSWNNSPTSYAYQWQYNDQGSLFVNIAGATSSTYSPPSTFFNFYVSPIRCRVTATNSIGSTSADSNQVTVGAAVSPPTNATIPTLSPTSIAVGTTLTAGVGTWNNSPTSYDIRIYRGTAGVLTSETLVASGTSTTLTYTITQADYNSGQLYFRTYVNASNAGGSSGFVAGQERGPTTVPVSPPSNISQPTLSGSLSVGSTVTFGVGSWSNSPTSYDLRLYRGTQFVSSGETLVKSAGNVTSSTYTITSADFSSGQLYLRAFASASNSGGSSGLVAGQEIGPITSGGGGSAPATPTGVGLTGSGVVSWTASSGATSYEIEFYTAQSGSGASAAGPYSVTGISGSPYQLVSPYASPNNWARVRVRARNSNGASAYSAWVPSETSYT